MTRGLTRFGLGHEQGATSIYRLDSGYVDVVRLRDLALTRPKQTSVYHILVYTTRLFSAIINDATHSRAGDATHSRAQPRGPGPVGQCQSPESVHKNM